MGIAAIVLFGALLVAALFMFGSAPIANVFANDIASTTLSVGNSDPSVDDVVFNSAGNITLSENTFVIASTTVTVSDANGCSNISSVEATAYRSLAQTDGTTCTQDDNDCYEEFIACAATTTGNTCTGGADTSAEYDCSFRFWYLADPTDGTAPNATNIWVVAATATDASAGTGTATNTDETVEVTSLAAHDVTSDIAHGSVGAGTDTGATNQTATITNTGNRSLDTDIGGDIMCTDWSTCSGGVILEDQQKFGLTDVTYASLSNTLTATGSPATITTILAKPTATTSAITDDTYWGVAVPGGQVAGSYEGQNVFTANADD